MLSIFEGLFFDRHNNRLFAMVLTVRGGARIWMMGNFRRLALTFRDIHFDVVDGANRLLPRLIRMTMDLCKRLLSGRGSSYTQWSRYSLMELFTPWPTPWGKNAGEPQVFKTVTCARDQCGPNDWVGSCTDSHWVQLSRPKQSVPFLISFPDMIVDRVPHAPGAQAS